MPRLVRRAPLHERILSNINPLDFWLHLATSLEGYDFDTLQKTVSFPLGVACNFVLCVARANSSLKGARDESDVLWRPGMEGRSGWGRFWASLSWMLLIAAFVNAGYCLARKKRYRLFEQDINLPPSTPSARRVPVASSPSTISIDLLSTLLAPFTTLLPESPSSHTTTVWELSIWDPTPLSLSLLTLFSPVHASLYFLTLPISASSTTAASSGTYFTLFLTLGALSTLLTLLVSQFQQQAKDRSILHKSVLHEYDAKYVAPRLNISKRDVAVSTDEGGTAEAYTPETKTGFVVRPNRQYADWTDMDSPTNTRSASLGESFTARLTGSAASSRRSSIFSPPKPQNLFGGTTASNLQRRAVSNSVATSTTSTSTRENRFSEVGTGESPAINRKLRFPITPKRSTSPVKRAVSQGGYIIGEADQKAVEYGGSVRERRGTLNREESPRKRILW